MDDERPKFHSGKFLHYTISWLFLSCMPIFFNIGTFENHEKVNETRPHRPLSQTVSQSRTAAATNATDHHEPTAEPCLNHAWGPKKYYYWNHPLQLMVYSGNELVLATKSLDSIIVIHLQLTLIQALPLLFYTCEIYTFLIYNLHFKLKGYFL